mmetsp:Transcript_10229/g.33519  ORF Transcript_10229/g.33519 Transcript_10229/m.33519 type:complete len:278 (-) Transcript_10229:452-1285(-)
MRAARIALLHRDGDTPRKDDSAPPPAGLVIPELNRHVQPQLLDKAVALHAVHHHRCGDVLVDIQCRVNVAVPERLLDVGVLGMDDDAVPHRLCDDEGTRLRDDARLSALLVELCAGGVLSHCFRLCRAALCGGRDELPHLGEARLRGGQNPSGEDERIARGLCKLNSKLRLGLLEHDARVWNLALGEGVEAKETTERLGHLGGNVKLVQERANGPQCIRQCEGERFSLRFEGGSHKCATLLLHEVNDGVEQLILAICHFTFLGKELRGSHASQAHER